DPKRVGDLNDLTAQQVADATKLAPSAGAAAPGSLKAQVDTCASRAHSAAQYSSLVHERLPANPAAVGSAMTLANGAITADALAADAVAEIQSGLSTFDPTIDPVIVATNNDKSGYTLSASGVQAIWEYASRSLTTFGTLVSDIAATVWSWFTRTITGGSLTTSPPTAAQIADAVWDETLADHAGAGSTGAALSGATAPTAAAIADAVWDEAIAEHATAGSTGKLLQNADVATSTRSTFDSATDTVIVSTNNDKSGYTLSASGVQAIWEYASRSLTTFGTLVSDIAATVWSWFTRTITGGSLTTSPPTAAQIADAVWDETLADHAGAGSTGAALSGATAPTAAAIADAVWDEAIAEHATAGSTGAALAAAQSAGDPWATELPGAYGSGTAGKIVGNIDSQLESIANRTQIPG
ncbi:MAG TPA: hypothetical protein PK801_12980, partial [Aggregatilineales bacterium]|nr:hypothetical protein [Aggregatilineales bacterium]